ncbi:hypothetical protein DVH24_021430, partial [Malus domestica]
PEEDETVVGPKQVAKNDETVVAPKRLKGDADDEMIDVQQQEEDDDCERTISNVLEKGNVQTDDENIQMTLAAKRVENKMKMKITLTHWLIVRVSLASKFQMSKSKMTKMLHMILPIQLLKMKKEMRTSHTWTR